MSQDQGLPQRQQQQHGEHGLGQPEGVQRFMVALPPAKRQATRILHALHCRQPGQHGKGQQQHPWAQCVHRARRVRGSSRQGRHSKVPAGRGGQHEHVPLFGHQPTGPGRQPCQRQERQQPQRPVTESRCNQHGHADPGCGQRRGAHGMVGRKPAGEGQADKADGGRKASRGPAHRGTLSASALAQARAAMSRPSRVK